MNINEALRDQAASDCVRITANLHHFLGELQAQSEVIVANIMRGEADDLGGTRSEMVDAARSCAHLPWTWSVMEEWGGLAVGPGVFVGGLIFELADRLAHFDERGGDWHDHPLIGNLRNDAISWHFCKLAVECAISHAHAYEPEADEQEHYAELLKRLAKLRDITGEPPKCEPLPAPLHLADLLA